MSRRVRVVARDAAYTQRPGVGRVYRAWPGLVPHPASYVILGMAGFFSAAARTPFSTLVIVSEMTGDYHLLLPALWVCVLAFILSDDHLLFRSQVENRAASPAHRRPAA